MACVVVNKSNTEAIHHFLPKRHTNNCWVGTIGGQLDIGIILPNGSIEKLIGRKLTWADEPVYLT